MSDRQPKPCPSCGGTALPVIHHRDLAVSTASSFFVRCNMCNLRGPWAGSREEATDLWDALPRREDKTTVHLPCPDCGRRITIVMHDRQLGGDHE